ncbi:MAG: DNA polymerase III subunit beta [Legionellaceae bacterium]|nr:DNA polymerase III subunit beta [Legionellaceae bacterium]
MFDIVIAKSELLPPLLALAAVVDKRQSLPVLANILFEATAQGLHLSATDLEVDLRATVRSDISVPGVITIPAKKLVDIVRSLDDESPIRLLQKDNYLVLQSGRSTFRLAVLSAADFPQSRPEHSLIELTLARSALQRLFQSTYFAMSQQDVRIYLNGLLMEFASGSMTSVATDGHRMAVCQSSESTLTQQQRIIVPRKGVQEILRLLASVPDVSIRLQVGEAHLSVISEHFSFSTKLLESRYPAYHRVIPRQFSCFVLLDRDDFKRALARIMILAHEKTHAVVLAIEKKGLCLVAHNQQQEEASEELEAQVDGPELRIGVNAAYLMDALNHVAEGLIRLSLVDADSSILLETLADEQYQYVIMPMKI